MKKLFILLSFISVRAFAAVGAVSANTSTGVLNLPTNFFTGNSAAIQSALGSGFVVPSGGPSSGQTAEFNGVASIVGVNNTGTGSYVKANTPSLVTPHLGTPADGVLTNCTGLPLATGITGNLPIANLASGTGASSTTVLFGDNTWRTPAGGGNVSTSGTITSGQTTEWNGATTVISVANTGTGNYVKATSPSLITPLLGTPTSGVLTNCTGLPLTTGITGNLGVTHLNSGTGASSATAWFGDETWKTLALVATSGAYSDLRGTPSISALGLSGNLEDVNSGSGLNLNVSTHGQGLQITTNGDTDNLIGFYSFNFGTFNGYIRVGSGATAYVSSSDQRLKTPLRHWSLGRKFDDIPFGEFNWLASGKIGHGTLAQELYKIYPDAVAVGTDERALNPRTGKMALVKPWCVDYPALVVPTAIRVQEIDHELDLKPSTVEIRIFEVLAFFAFLLGIRANLRKN